MKISSSVTNASRPAPAGLLGTIKKLSDGDKVYVVGGWLRDKLLGRENRDLDVVCRKNPLRLAKMFSTAAGGRFVLLDRANRIYRVVLKDRSGLEYVDFAGMKAGDIISDLLRRDFTVNSMAAEIKKGGELDTLNILDPSNGRSDLKKSLIRMTSTKSFVDDPLRLLRAFRIAAELDFIIEPNTLKAARHHSGLILKSAAERVRDELVKILTTDNAAAWIASLEESGILERLVPEITPMKRSARKFYFHPKGLWQHSQETLSSLEVIFSGLDKYFPGTHAEVEAHLRSPLSSGLTRKTLLKLTAVLHDCAKPECAVKYEKKTRFLGHEKKGAKIVEKILRRLRFSSKDIAIAKSVTASHMRPVSLSQTGVITQRASFRLFRDMGDNTTDLLLLSLADWHSYKRIKSTKPRNLKMQESVLKELLTRYFAHRVKQDAPKLIDGNILMKRLKLVPGPIVGALLKLVAEAQALGKIRTEREALALASSKLTQLSKKYKITTTN